MVWLREKTAPVTATQLNLLSFEIVGPNGKAVDDSNLMEMGSNAEFIKKEDGPVFAHLHPDGVGPNGIGSVETGGFQFTASGVATAAK